MSQNLYQLYRQQARQRLERARRVSESYAAGDFKEELHDRDEGGQFTSGGGAGLPRESQDDLDEILNDPDRFDPLSEETAAVEDASERNRQFESLGSQLQHAFDIWDKRDRDEGVGDPPRQGDSLLPDHDPGDCPECLEQPFSADPNQVKLADEKIASLRPKTRNANTDEERKAAFTEFFNAVKEHPYQVEVKRRMDELAEDVPKGEMTAVGAKTKTHGGRVTQWSAAKYTDPDTGDFTPERKELHEELLHTHQFPDRDHVGLLNPNAKKKKGPNDKPVAVFLMGNPGSGKTSSGLPLVKELTGLDPGEFTNLNADDVKSAMPEYEGWNAGAVHEESSWLVEGQATDAATKKGEEHNIIFDLVGKDSDKMQGMADRLTEKGYDIHVVQTRLDEEESAARAWDRGRKNALGSDDPGNPKNWGRHVPVEYVFKDVDGLPTQTFDMLKDHPGVSNWSAVDTDVQRGTQAPVIDQGNKTIK